MKQGVTTFQRALGEVQLGPRVSLFPLPPLPFSLSIHSSELQLGQIFSEESDVCFHVWSCLVSVCVCVCLHIVLTLHSSHMQAKLL